MDNEPLWLFYCHRMSTLKQRLRLQIDWRQKRTHFSVYYVECKICRTKGHNRTLLWLLVELIPPLTLTACQQNLR